MYGVALIPPGAHAEPACSLAALTGCPERGSCEPDVAVRPPLTCDRISSRLPHAAVEGAARRNGQRRIERAWKFAVVLDAGAGYTVRRFGPPLVGRHVDAGKEGRARAQRQVLVRQRNARDYVGGTVINGGGRIANRPRRMIRRSAKFKGRHR